MPSMLLMQVRWIGFSQGSMLTFPPQAHRVANNARTTDGCAMESGEVRLTPHSGRVEMS
jgi:hypothetical protein